MNEELKVIISAEVSKFKKGIEDAKKQINDFKSKVQEASKDVDSKIKSMGEGMAKGLKVGATALAGVTTAILALGASTAECSCRFDSITCGQCAGER